MEPERKPERNLPGPVFYLVALFQSLGFHMPYFFLPEDPLATVMSGRRRSSASQLKEQADQPARAEGPSPSGSIAES